ncbi:hypothetical protein NLJ89_g9884 [Agrocybe chaxingu]|uniref:Uncharacterized protein n=1 Tax=Agrocybe chaxingu TaxID=84603 RepID=A0A9W8JS76_9AGAR|nr:hypothetical protein NLJ89_g9884 [Agrocybe chaxingu]
MNADLPKNTKTDGSQSAAGDTVQTLDPEPCETNSDLADETPTITIVSPESDSEVPADKPIVEATVESDESHHALPRNSEGLTSKGKIRVSAAPSHSSGADEESDSEGSGDESSSEDDMPRFGYIPLG